MRPSLMARDVCMREPVNSGSRGRPLEIRARLDWVPRSLGITSRAGRGCGLSQPRGWISGIASAGRWSPGRSGTLWRGPMRASGRVRRGNGEYETTYRCGPHTLHPAWTFPLDLLRKTQLVGLASSHCASRDVVRNRRIGPASDLHKEVQGDTRKSDGAFSHRRLWPERPDQAGKEIRRA